MHLYYNVNISIVYKCFKEKSIYNSFNMKFFNIKVLHNVKEKKKALINVHNELKFFTIKLLLCYNITIYNLI